MKSAVLLLVGALLILGSVEIYSVSGGLSVLLDQATAVLKIQPSLPNSKVSNVSTLLSVATQPKIVAKQLPSQISALENEILSNIQDPEYQKALSILNDVTLKESYQNTLFNIQNFFLNYATQQLHAAFESNQAHSNPSLTALLTQATVGQPALQKTSSSVENLSTLLQNVAASENKTTTSKAAMPAFSVLFENMESAKVATPEPKGRSGLQDLLQVVNMPLLPPVATTVNESGVMALLSEAKSTIASQYASVTM